MKHVTIIMGSESDKNIADKSVEVLEKFGVPYNVEIASAHREPEKVKNVVKNAKAIIIPELNYTGFIAEQVERVKDLEIPIIKIPKVGLFHHPDDILKIIREVSK